MDDPHEELLYLFNNSWGIYTRSLENQFSFLVFSNKQKSDVVDFPLNMAFNFVRIYGISDSQKFI